MKHPPRIPRGDNSSKNTSSLTPPDPQHLQSPENSGALVALWALQFLPLPLLVLSAQKTVVLANDAMGELLGTNRKLLRGKSLDALGIELLADNGSWDLLLEDARIGNNGRQIVEVPQSDGHVRLCEAMMSPWKGVGGEMHFTVMFWREPLETIKDVGDSKSLPSASSLINSAQPVNGKDSRVLSSSSFVQSRSLNRWTPQFLQQLPAPSLRIIRPLDSIIEQMVSGRLIFEAGNYLPDKDKGGGEDVGALTPRVLDLQQRLDAEEAKFRKMYDCIPRMIWTATPAGEHDYFSKRWYEYTGLAPELCVGSVAGRQAIILCVKQDDISAVNEKWKQSVASGDGCSAEYRVRQSDGGHRWMLGRAVPLKDPETGKVLKWYGTATDIHDMVEARTAEKATREQLAEALIHAELTLWAVDRDRKFTLLEGGIIWQTRDNPGYYIGKDIKDIFDEIDPNDRYHHQFVEPIDPLLRGEISEGFTETELDGHWFKTKYVPMRKGPGGKNGANHVTGIIGLSMDMTKMHATELELRERERQNRILLANENAAKEASKLKSDFLASMSHEIRTPIAGVVGMCEILLDTALSTEQRELTEGIQRSANTLLTVINDILDLSKVESGKLDIEEVQFNLSLVIRDVVKMLSFEAERKKLQFKYEIDFPCPNDLTVMGDPGRVRQILANLLSNALKFTHKGSVELKARMKYQGEEMMEIHFVINDTGIGILETDQCRLFQPFTQADSSTARRFGGTGLGLSICQKLVSLMGGTIGLSSKAGEGTSAYFAIPFKKIGKHSPTNTHFDSIPERLQSDTSVNVSSPSPKPFTNSPSSYPTLAASPERLPSDLDQRRKCHVLVVDDNEINQQIAIRLIQKLHFTVSAVCNGVECLVFIKASTALPSSTDPSSTNPPYLRRPDVILMDVQMPEMDGYAATRAIRGEGGWLGNVPIVALTASAIKGDREKCRDAGMDDYLSKPVHGHMLEKMLIKWCFKAREVGAGDLAVVV